MNSNNSSKKRYASFVDAEVETDSEPPEGSGRSTGDGGSPGAREQDAIRKSSRTPRLIILVGAKSRSNELHAALLAPNSRAEHPSVAAAIEEFDPHTLMVCEIGGDQTARCTLELIGAIELAQVHAADDLREPTVVVFVPSTLAKEFAVCVRSALDTLGVRRAALSVAAYRPWYNKAVREAN